MVSFLLISSITFWKKNTKKRPILLYFANFSIRINIGAFKLKKLDHLSSIYSSYDTFIIDLWGVMHNGIKLNSEAIKTVDNLFNSKKNVKQSIPSCLTYISSVQTSGVVPGFCL